MKYILNIIYNFFEKTFFIIIDTKQIDIKHLQEDKSKISIASIQIQQDKILSIGSMKKKNLYYPFDIQNNIYSNINYASLILRYLINEFYQEKPFLMFKVIFLIKNNKNLNQDNQELYLLAKEIGATRFAITDKLLEKQNINKLTYVNIESKSVRLF